MEETMIIEYNTDSYAGTFDRLKSILRRLESDTGKISNRRVSISPEAAESFVRGVFSNLYERLVDELSSAAISRMNSSGRWDKITASELICEVMTDNSVRRGALSSIGRIERRNQIKKYIDSGTIQFAILLLPFRTASPIKNRGTLPDLGEVYTLVLLAALARASEVAQEKIRATCERILMEICSTGLDSIVVRTPGLSNFDRNRLTDSVLDAARVSCPIKSSYAARRKALVRAVRELREISVVNYELLGDLLDRLSAANISLDTCWTFLAAKIVRVQVLGVQDAGRYPCFSTTSMTTIAKYRKLLLDFVSFLQLPKENFRLVAYEEIADRMQSEDRYTQNEFYEARLKQLRLEIDACLKKLYIAGSREDFHRILSESTTTPQLSTLFEAILFSIVHPTLNTGNEFTSENIRHYVVMMSNIYEAASNEASEIIRRRIIFSSLNGAAEYCAAYESNTGSKNPSGFDDVAVIAPDALRMSIHRKQESIGHFSVSVSPSHGRTPWHGTVAFHRQSSANTIGISVDLAVDLEADGYYAVHIDEAAKASASGWTEGYINEKQAIFYMCPSFFENSQDTSDKIARLASMQLRAYS
ncbi:hypothetical protein AVMA1855_07795 [Acidovorax sp. SUPP1855]|uniref:hypothetical protein n=1 Tax=Acidovorax sp. SUPP1855 TaxID=431774 RepID=UPI0023DE345F|nr:hypothetical protein [Acidovorax sp. SUPP1855]GKS84033.1 hypothetical protein AVMA1855_07795 [Acidovorax sp. SUPP1855]